jgi:hypothetical protein
MATQTSNLFMGAGIMKPKQLKQWKKIVIVSVMIGFIGILAWISYLNFFKEFRWFSWTGFGAYISPTGEYQRGKTLWDWMQLLIVPIILAFATLWFTKEEKMREQLISDNRVRIEREISLDKSRETALQNYLDKITELLVHDSLRESLPEAEARVAARVWTLTTLRILDGERKGILLKFIREAGLIKNGDSIIQLENADLSYVVASETDLSFANFKKTNFQNAQLFHADFTGSNLSGTNFTNANLFESGLVDVDLSDANLSSAGLIGAALNGSNLLGANLSGAHIQIAQLEKTTNLIGAIMPDGSPYETL